MKPWPPGAAWKAALSLAVVAALFFAGHRLSDSRAPAAAESDSAPRAAPPAHQTPPLGESSSLRPRAIEPSEGLRDAHDRALVAALGQQDPAQRRKMLRQAAKLLAAEGDVLTAGDYAAALLASADRAAHLDAFAFTRLFADELTQRDAAATMAWCSALPEPLQEIAAPAIARHLARHDAASLTAWTTSLESPLLRAAVIRAASQQLAERTGAPDAARWAVALAQTPDGARCSDAVAHVWARYDFAAAAEWAGALRADDDREAALRALGQVAAASEPARALAWAAQLPDEQMRNGVIDQALKTWADSDPVAAAAWHDTRPANSAPLPSAVEHIAHAWMARDPQNGARWIARTTLPPATKDYLIALSSASPRPRP